MKVRNGFVSNSSSSSFIVGFPIVPDSAEVLKEMLFGQDTEVRLSYGDYESTTDLAERIFLDLGKVLSPEEMVEEASSGYLCMDTANLPDLDEDEFSYDYYYRRGMTLLTEEVQKVFGPDCTYMDVIWNDNWTLATPEQKEHYKRKYREAVEKAHEDHRKEVFNVIIKWLNSNPEGLTYMKFEYGDESGQAVLEHGDVFHKLVHLRISHH